MASPILSFMPPMIGNALLVVAVAWLCNVILARQANGFAELGLYVAANQWRAMIVFIPFAVQSVAAPLLSKAYGAGDDAAFTHVYDNAFRTTLLSSALPAMVAIAFNDVIMGAFGKSFASGAWILILIAFTSVLMAIANFLGLILQMRDAVWATLFATTASAATAISGAYLFSPGRGAIGLATALLLASLIQVLVLASVVAQRVAVDVRQLLKMSTLCLLTIGGVAMVAISVPGSIPAKTAALCISSVVLIAICSRGTFAAGSWRPIRTTSGNSFLAMKSQEEAENARS